MMPRNTRQILFVSALTLGCVACSGGHDSKTEDQMIKALKEHRSDQVTSIDLNSILPKGWSKVCVQTPYQMQEELEKAANTPMKNFKMITDDATLTMWIFDAKGGSSYITIPRKTTMDFSSPNVIHNICTDSQQPELNMTMIKDTKTFYFN